MDSIYVIFNCLLYFFSFIIAWSKHRAKGHRIFEINVYLTLMFVYFFVSFMCVYNYFVDTNKWHFLLWPFVYLFVTNMLMINPLKSSKLELSRSPIINISFYKIVAWLYICVALFSVYVYMPIAIQTYMLGQWNEVYSEAHLEQNISVLQKCANLFFHVRFLGLLLFFAFLSYYRKFNFFMILLGVSAILPLIIVTITNASRGGLVALIFSVFITFQIFRNLYTREVLRIIKMSSLSIIPFFVIYLTAVTISRFDETFHYEDIDSTSSVINYLGHSMLMFNYGLVDTINRFMEGAYMWNIPTSINTGAHFGTGFFTGIGALYIDYGPIVTVMIVIIVSMLIGRVANKNRLDMPDLFLLITYIMHVFNSVFVLGVGYGQQWIETIILYLLLKLFQKMIGTK